jgi:hypothetical protein
VGEVVLGQIRQDPPRLVIASELVVQPCEHAVDDRIGPEGEDRWRGLLGLGELVETTLTAPEEVEL